MYNWRYPEEREDKIVYDAGDWYIVRKTREVFTNDRREILKIGSVKKIRGSKNKAALRVRLKSVFRYRVMATTFHVMSDRRCAITRHPEPLEFGRVGDAINAGRQLMSA